MRLRDAQPSDAEAVAAIYRPAVESGVATFEAVAPSTEEMAGRMAAVAERGLPWLVADLDGAVVGYAYAARWKDRIGYRFSVEDSVYVAPAAQSRGVGRTLLDALIARCSGRELRQMAASIGGPAAASVALHKACGFREVGRLRRIGVKFGRELDVVLMQRSLTPEN